MFGTIELMTEEINERVSVVTVYDSKQAMALPCRIKWKGWTYKINKVAFYHPVREGRLLNHIYSVCDGTTSFKLKFNTESQQWWLEEISDGLAN